MHNPTENVYCRKLSLKLGYDRTMKNKGNYTHQTQINFLKKFYKDLKM